MHPDLDEFGHVVALSGPLQTVSLSEWQPMHGHGLQLQELAVGCIQSDETIPYSRPAGQ